jgi:hypothetical protein
MTGMHCTAGLGLGRHEVAEGLGRPSVDEGRRGKMGPATGVLCRAGPIQGRAGRGQPSAVGVEPGWPACGEWGAGVAGAWGVGSRVQKNGESEEE